jgi:hypothetical protein
MRYKLRARAVRARTAQSARGAQKAAGKRGRPARADAALRALCARCCITRTRFARPTARLPSESRVPALVSAIDLPERKVSARTTSATSYVLSTLEMPRAFIKSRRKCGLTPSSRCCLDGSLSKRVKRLSAGMIARPECAGFSLAGASLARTRSARTSATRASRQCIRSVFVRTRRSGPLGTRTPGGKNASHCP